MNNELLLEAYREVVEFVTRTGDTCFLEYWNEGEWQVIIDEWPEFDMQSEAQQYLIEQSGGMFND